MGSEGAPRIKRGTKLMSLFVICVVERSKEGFAP